MSVGKVEHIGRFVPCAAHDIALAGGRFVSTPLLHVAGHIVSARPAHTVVSPGRRRSFATKVAGGYQAGAIRRGCSSRPVINGRKRPACKVSISIRLEPAHTGDRIFALALWVFPFYPGGRSWPVRFVDKEFYRVGPRKYVSILAEFVLPVLLLLVTSLIHKAFELAIGDLELIDPVFPKPDCGQGLQARNACNSPEGERVAINRSLVDRNRNHSAGSIP